MCRDCFLVHQDVHGLVFGNESFRCIPDTFVLAAQPPGVLHHVVFLARSGLWRYRRSACRGRRSSPSCRRPPGAFPASLPLRARGVLVSSLRLSALQSCPVQRAMSSACQFGTRAPRSGITAIPSRVKPCFADVSRPMRRCSRCGWRCPSRPSARRWAGCRTVPLRQLSCTSMVNWAGRTDGACTKSVIHSRSYSVQALHLQMFSECKSFLCK